MLSELFAQPDLRHSMLGEWTNLKQEADEELTRFMLRVRETCDRAFARQFSESQKQTMAVNAFARGLLDPDVARLVMVHAPDNVNKALQIATSANAISNS